MPLQYSAVENIVTGLGGAFSKARSWSPRKSQHKRNKRRLSALYHETIAKQVINLPIKGLASGQPIFRGDPDLPLYSAVVQKVSECRRLADLFGYAWVTPLWSTHSILDSIPGGDEVLVLKGFRNLDSYVGLDYLSYESTLVPLYSDIVLYESIKAAIAETIGEFAMLVMGIPEFIQSAKDCSFTQSMQNLAQVKSVTGVTTVDAQGFQNIIQYDYTSILKVLSAAEEAISASSGIPRVILFQKSPEGSTSGRFEIARWLELLYSLEAEWIAAINTLLASSQARFRLEGLSFQKSLDMYQ